MAGPLETTKRRRWPLAVLAVVLLLAAGQIAWSFRPLNATERQLVGKWEADPQTLVYEFRADRRFSVGAFSGSWHASPGMLVFRMDVWRKRPLKERIEAYLRQLFHPRRIPISLDGPDRISLNDYSYQRVRD